MFKNDIKILVVDDMLTMRKLVIKALRAHGFEHFIEAADGERAWERLNEFQDIKLVISDWNMPNVTGIDLLKRLRADDRFSALPFIMLTAESESTQVAESISAGVDNYITKPFTADVLGKKLEAVYKKYQGRAPNAA